MTRPPARATRRRGVRVLAATALLLAAAPAVAQAHAPAAAPTTAPATQSVSDVTLVLRAPDPAALRRAATDHAAGPLASRRAAVARLLPDAAARDAVTGWLRSHGLAVGAQTAWTIQASAPAARIAALFGTRPTLPHVAQPSADRIRAAAGPLSVLPAALAGQVAIVLPTHGGPALFHPMVTSALTGADFRNAYAAAGAAPSGGADDQNLTVATVQLANFDPSDLTQYAAGAGLPDPVASGQFRSVPLDGGAPTDADGSVEVSLDQESILSTAPTARQAAYFGPNDGAGFARIFSAVLDDVTQDARATAPDPGIVALSSSWGACEAYIGPAEFAAEEPILESLVAAGVTVFSAAGDDGIYDCGSYDGTGTDNATADVDWPGSSPFVVSVGGTNLSEASGTSSTSDPNTGTNWTESVWGCATPSDCEVGHGGTGGGVSGSAYGTIPPGSGTTDTFKGWPLPAYQGVAVAGSATYGSVTRRMVPDIAADADPATGFTVHNSNYSDDFVTGGTSLATPVSAALLTNALGDAHLTHGIGDIHVGLYSAYARTRGLAADDPARPLRDITVGQNGAVADRGADPSVTAAPGFDTVSGVGSPLWSALLPWLTDTSSPTPAARLTLDSPRTATHPYAAHATWAVSPTTYGSAVSSVEITITRQGASTPVADITRRAARGSIAVTVAPGTAFTETVVGQDLAGHTVTTSSVLRVPRDTTALAIAAPSTPVHAGATFTVAGRLVDVTSHRALGGRQVALWAKRPGTTRWKLLTTVRSSARGVVAAKGAIGRSVSFQWRFAGDSGHTAVASSARTVSVG